MGILFGALGVAGIVAGVLVLALVGGIVWGIGSSSGWWGKNKGLPPAARNMRRQMGEARRPVAYLDAEGDVSPEEILSRVSSLMFDPVLGRYVTAASDALKKSGFQRDAIYAIMEREFGEGSLTWDKFSVPVDLALDGIRSNAARMANRMQGIDSKEYQRLARLEEAGAVKEGTPQEASLAATREAFAELDRLAEANERMLSELDRLQAELSRMSGTHEVGTTDEIVEELRILSEDAKEYA